MRIELLAVTPRSGGKKGSRAQSLAQEYIAKIGRFFPAEATVFDSEAMLLKATTARGPGREVARLVLFDSRGDSLTSEEFAGVIGGWRDGGAQRILFAVGPADGWSTTALAAAHRTVSLGRMTLPHELARVVVAEQVYRAFTILAGHPYHLGH